MGGARASAPGTGSEAKLAVSAWRTAWSCCCSASVRLSSRASSCSRRSRALLMFCVCLCSTAFCSSKATFIFRRRRSSASRAAAGSQVRAWHFLPVPSARPLPELCPKPGLQPLLCLQPQPLAPGANGQGRKIAPLLGVTTPHSLPPAQDPSFGLSPLPTPVSPRTLSWCSPLFWSKNSSVKMGTSKVEKPSQSPPWDKTGGNVYFEGASKHPLGFPPSLGDLLEPLRSESV